MIDAVALMVGAILRLFWARQKLLLENLVALRQQLTAVKRRHPRPGWPPWPCRLKVPTVRSVKEECIAKLILLGERSLKRTLHHYELHYHDEQNHQGKDNLLLFPSPTLPLNRKKEKVRCQERLGGLLKYYEREAA